MTLSSAPLESTVWWAHTSAASERLLRLLDGDELARQSRFRLQADRDRHLLGRSLARLVLAEHAGCAPEKVTFELRCLSCEDKSRTGADEGRGDSRSGGSGGSGAAPHGKPVPTGAAQGWEISVSHSGEWVALALAREVPVGVDVERLSDSRDLAGLAGYTLADSEHEVWRALPEEGKAGAFFGYWARKEALLKATGLGLSGGLRRVSVSPPHARARLLSWEGGGGPESAWLSDLDRGAEYRSALAVLTDRPVRLAVHPPEHTADLLRG